MERTRFSVARRIRTVVLMVGAFAVASCDSVDAILESDAESSAYLRVSWPAPEIRVSPGEVLAISMPITRLDGYDRAVSVAIEDLPAGVTHTVSTAPSGADIMVAIEVTVASSIALGDYQFTIRVLGDRLKDATRAFVLKVVEPPSFSLDAQPAEVRVIRGGIAPITIAVARDNFPAPVTLTVGAEVAIGGTFSTNPVQFSETAGHIAVGADVIPGTYPVTITGTADGSIESTTISVIVAPEDLQIIAASEVSVRQGRTVSRTIVVNARPEVGTVTLMAEGLPDGATAEFSQVSAHEFTMSYVVLPGVATGTHAITVRAQAAGFTDATASVSLLVERSTITLSSSPVSARIFPGTSTTVFVALERVALDTTVSITVENSPAGLTLAAEPSEVTGNGTSLLLEASSVLDAGTYDVTIVATPSGWSRESALELTLSVLVHESPSGTGNVILDWTRCGAPTWAAFQDGSGEWTRVQPSLSAARIAVTSGRGGIAQVRDAGVDVRFLTQAELTDAPEDMCPPPAYTRSATGTGKHTHAEEQGRYGLGGGYATSSTGAPNFTITNVAPGTNDLIAWATNTPSGTRGFIRRDVNPPDGGSLGEVDFQGAESFEPLSISVTSLTAGTNLTSSMAYLTRPSCLPVLLVEGSPISSTSPRVGTLLIVPSARQRPSDLHEVTVQEIQTNRVRAITVRTHAPTSVSVQKPSSLTLTPEPAALPGSYKRLQFTMPSVPATYDRSSLLEFSASGKVVTVMVSRPYSSLSSATSVELATPNFTGVDGWQDSFAPASAATVAWSLVFRGGNPGQNCEPSVTYKLSYAGTH